MDVILDLKLHDIPNTVGRPRDRPARRRVRHQPHPRRPNHARSRRRWALTCLSSAGPSPPPPAPKPQQPKPSPPMPAPGSPLACSLGASPGSRLRPHHAPAPHRGWVHQCPMPMRCGSPGVDAPAVLLVDCLGQAAATIGFVACWAQGSTDQAHCLRDGRRDGSPCAASPPQFPGDQLSWP